MLTRLDLEHFKCFELLRLPLGQLTLLAGWNGSGKSSALQALVLLHQTMVEQEWSTRLLLNGNELRLGTVLDVVDKVTGRHTFSIGIFDNAREVRWTFTGEDKRDMSFFVATVRSGASDHPAPGTLRFLLPPDAAPEDTDMANRLRRLSYLTAERVGPREVYPLNDPSSHQVVGPRGENAVSMLHWNRREAVQFSLVRKGSPPTRIRQVEAWMQEFFPGCSLDVQQVPQANGVTLGLRTSDATDFHRPIHVGFGLTQVLPIIVSALSAEPGDLLLIENPEVHLHPAGQAMMGRFMAMVAATNVQVILETHSDHVLNGIRRAVKEGIISPEGVCIHYFKVRGEEGQQVVSPMIDRTGNIDAWPTGFFDQFDKDMNYFAGWSD